MALQQTAHDACSRRVHCVTKGYMHDPFVHFFARDLTMVNSPLMNRGTWLRAQAFENMVFRFAALHPEGPIQVVSLGAGVDTLFFRLRHQGAPLNISRYLEVDLADLIEEKQHTIHAHEELRKHTLDGVYQAVPGDLQHAEQMVALFRQFLVPEQPTLLLAECVFVYIDSGVVENLLRHSLNDFFVGDVMLVNYDVMEPQDRFGTMMQENLRERGIILHGVVGTPSLASHVERCKRVGLKTCRAVSMRTLYLQVPKATQVQLNKIEMIDDWDEWNLVHDHYCFVIGWKGGDGTPASIPAVFPQPQ